MAKIRFPRQRAGRSLPPRRPAINCRRSTGCDPKDGARPKQLVNNPTILCQSGASGGKTSIARCRRYFASLVWLRRGWAHAPQAVSETDKRKKKKAPCAGPESYSPNRSGGNVESIPCPIGPEQVGSIPCPVGRRQVESIPCPIGRSRRGDAWPCRLPPARRRAARQREARAAAGPRWWLYPAGRTSGRRLRRCWPPAAT